MVFLIDAHLILFIQSFLQQVCDPNGRWYLADGGSAPGDLLLLTGKALSHATAGLRPAASYRAAPDYLSGTSGSGRYKLLYNSVFIVMSLVQHTFQICNLFPKNFVLNLALRL